MDYVDIKCTKDAEFDISRYRNKRHKKKTDKKTKKSDIKSSKSYEIKKEDKN